MPDKGIYYFLGNITSHVIHALPLWRVVGGTFIVTSKQAKLELLKYNVPVICIDDIPYVWRIGRKGPYKMREYISLDKRFIKTTDFLNTNAHVVVFYELFEFSTDVRISKPRTIFLTHGNMLKNYFKMHPKRLETIKYYDSIAALGPFMKQEFIKSGIDPSKLIEVGIARTDSISLLKGAIKIPESMIRIGIPAHKPVISYMPTFWGDSSVGTLGLKILPLIPSSYTVIFRPHPQTPGKIIKKYTDIAAQHDHIYCLPEKGLDGVSLQDLYSASAVIMGDLSSVMLEAILLDKPLIFVRPDSSTNPAPHKQIEEILSFSQTISINNLNKTPSIVRTAIDDGVDKKLWNEVKARCFYDYGGGSVKRIATLIKNS